MRPLYVLIILLTTHLSVHAQCDSSLNGSWKIVAFSTGDVNFNYISGLTFISPDFDASYPDSAFKNKLIASLKDAFKEHSYKFDSNGQFQSQLAKDQIETGIFCYIKETGELKLTYKNALGNSITTDAKAVFNKGLLVIRVPKANKQGVYEYSYERKVE
jgi:hypothetical protein